MLVARVSASSQLGGICQPTLVNGGSAISALLQLISIRRPGKAANLSPLSSARRVMITSPPTSRPVSGISWSSRAGVCRSQILEYPQIVAQQQLPKMLFHVKFSKMYFVLIQDGVELTTKDIPHWQNSYIMSITAHQQGWFKTGSWKARSSPVG